MKCAPSFSISYVPFEDDFASIIKQLSTVAEPEDLILLLGAGKINRLAPLLH